MPKGIFGPNFTSIRLITCQAALRASWTHSKDAPRMRHDVNPLTGENQSFYFSEDHPTMPGWFKGMENIIQEHGLWPETGLLADCPGSKCPPGSNNCCCHTLLFNQPDFVCNGHYNRTPDLGKCVMWWNVWDLAMHTILDAKVLDHNVTWLTKHKDAS